MKLAEEVASEVMAKCVVENGGENVAFYLREAIIAARREGVEVAATHVEGLPAGHPTGGGDFDEWTLDEIAEAIRALELQPVDQ